MIKSRSQDKIPSASALADYQKRNMQIRESADAYYGNDNGQMVSRAHTRSNYLQEIP